jgi:hypothetical protein
MRKRTWSGGAYPNREGVEVKADGAGITIEPWYDGGVGILKEGDVRLTWGELDKMREASRGRNPEDSSTTERAEES